MQRACGRPGGPPARRDPARPRVHVCAGHRTIAGSQHFDAPRRRAAGARTGWTSGSRKPRPDRRRPQTLDHTLEGCHERLRPGLRRPPHRRPTLATPSPVTPLAWVWPVVGGDTECLSGQEDAVAEEVESGASHSRAHATMRRCRSVRVCGAMVLIDFSRARVRCFGRVAGVDKIGIFVTVRHTWPLCCSCFNALGGPGASGSSVKRCEPRAVECGGAPGGLQ